MALFLRKCVCLKFKSQGYFCKIQKREIIIDFVFLTLPNRDTYNKGEAKYDHLVSFYIVSWLVVGIFVKSLAYHFLSSRIWGKKKFRGTKLVRCRMCHKIILFFFLNWCDSTSQNTQSLKLKKKPGWGRHCWLIKGSIGIHIEIKTSP